MATAATITLSWSPKPNGSLSAMDVALDQPAPVDASSTDLVVPQNLGSVRLVRELGRGGMGLVWLGHHEFLDRPVAVKFMLGAAVAKEDARYQAFLDGARAASQVRHLAMTGVLHADLIEGVPYIVMEYISGPTLADVVERSGPLRLAATLAVLERIADALDALHTAGVLHRDIKPSNVLLDAAGQAYLTDFGLACRASNAAGSSGFGAASTAARPTPSACGTPAYMSPESFLGEASSRTDVYALALTTYHLLAGRPPYDGTVLEMREAHRRGELPEESLRARGVPPAVVEVVRRASATETIHRIKNARKFLEAFREASGTAAWARGALTEGVDQLARLYTVAKGIAPAPQPGQTLVAAASPATPTPAPSAFATPQPTAAPVLESNVPCEQCGYGLIGLPFDADCPQCQSPIERSLRSERLVFADAGWLSRVRRGTFLLGGAMITGALAPLIAAPLLATLESRHAAFLVACCIATFVSSPLIALAYGRAAMVEPGGVKLHPYQPWSWPVAAVPAAVAMLCATWAGIAAINAGLPDQLPSAGVAMAVSWLVLIGLVAPMLVYHAEMTLTRGQRLSWAASPRGMGMTLIAMGVGVIAFTGFRVFEAMSSEHLPAGLLFASYTAAAFAIALPAACVLLAFSGHWRRIERVAVARPQAESPITAKDKAPSKGSSYYQTLRTFTEKRRGG